MTKFTTGIGIVLGTRPEIIKNWSIVQALRARGIRHVVLHTNQHSDWLMQGTFFSELGYTRDRSFDGTYSFGRAVDWVSDRIEELQLNLILVNGDTAASLIGAIAGMYCDVEVAHVEAGLRCYDKEMYEERNRIMVDAIAHYLFTYTEREAQFLNARPELRGSIHNVGNTTVDLIEAYSDRLKCRRRGRFAYVTIHRKELTDRPNQLAEVFGAFCALAEELDEVVFPMHPRTLDAMQRYSIPRALLGKVVVTEPMGPLDSLAHIRHAAVVLTDSGCVQEEACILRTPCVTVRENSERMGTVEIGANVIAGWDPENIIECARAQLSIARDWPRIYGLPGAGERIVGILCQDNVARLSQQEAAQLA